MDSLMFSLNSTIPVFLVMVLGYVLNKMGFFSESFLNISDKLVFRVALPAMLFMDMSGIDLYSDFDLKYVAFCACATTVAFLSIWALAKLFIRDRKPFQRSHTWRGIYRKHLRRYGHGAAHDDRQRAAF